VTLAKKSRDGFTATDFFDHETLCSTSPFARTARDPYFEPKFEEFRPRTILRTLLAIPNLSPRAESNCKKGE
jgi:hypothetical protein